MGLPGFPKASFHELKRRSSDTVKGSGQSWAVARRKLEKGVSWGGLEGKLDAEEVKEGLENDLMESALMGVFISVTDKLPANALGFVPPNLMVSLDVLGQRKGAQLISRIIPGDSNHSP